jgi:hypothetical protein
MAQTQVGTPPAATTRPAAGTQAALAVWIGLSALVAVFLVGVVAFLSRDGWLDGAISSSTYVPEAGIQTTAIEPTAPVSPVAPATGPAPATAVLSVSVDASAAGEPAPELQLEPQSEAAPVAFPEAPTVPAASGPAVGPAPTSVPLRQLVTSAPPPATKPEQTAAQQPAALAPAKPSVQPAVAPQLKAKSDFTPPTPRPAQPTKAAFVPPSS